MLYIYTSVEEARKTKKNIVMDIESQYLLRYKSITEKYKDNVYALKILEEIEGMTNYQGDSLTAKFGTVSLNDISTGGKGCLLACIFNNEFIVNTDELGYNCIYLLCEISKHIDIFVLTCCEYSFLPDDVVAYVNGELCKGEEVIEMMEWLYE